MADQAPAIRVKNLVKHYGSKTILNELSMTVERGVIYGLLGSSGCGKTTLLSCLVGRKSPNSGEIKLFGYAPGEKGSGIPGRRLGYMPQELALVEEFTIKDAIYYFGTIFRMKPSDIERKFQHLSMLFELPPSDKFLKHCSGGQKRRVSFAAALIHDPELLILDEPTVGVDPILREKLWTHLKDIVLKHKTTVIITTHYIEETRDADMVGFLRHGKLIAQETPQRLLTLLSADTLEEAFLILSQRQETHEHRKSSRGISRVSLDTIESTASVDIYAVGYGSRDELTSSSAERKQKKDQAVYMSAMDFDMYRMRALFKKNFKQLYRSVGTMIFVIIFPIMQMTFFINSVGSDPKSLNLAIVNEESMTTLCGDFDWNGTARLEDEVCHFRNLTCRFLTYLEHPMINKVGYDNFNAAYESLQHGDAVGVLHIASNFSESYEQRFDSGSSAEPWIIDYGEIKAYMDMSNRQIGGTLTLKLIRLFVEFQDQLLKDCNYPYKVGRIPIENEFIYGEDDKPLSIFSSPGMSLMLVFLLGSTLTSQIIVKEKMDGVWDRSIVAGVSSLEITLGHLSLQCPVMFLVAAEVMFMLYNVPELKIVGSPAIMYFLLAFQGVCGMAYGFFVSSFSERLGSANLLCTGGFMPMTLISGVLWPIEAMPDFLRWVSLFTPCTMPILSFRNVMSKGWGFFHLQVINGIGVITAWILFFAVLSVWLIKLHR